MTDRELLERAAKAAGIKIDKSEFNGGGRGNTGFDALGNAVLDWHNGETWNPLTDDGDALRLAVKLGLNVYADPKRGYATAFSYDAPLARADEWSMSELQAATRHAIVRAAASMYEDASKETT